LSNKAAISSQPASQPASSHAVNQTPEYRQLFAVASRKPTDSYGILYLYKLHNKLYLQDRLLLLHTFRMVHKALVLLAECCSLCVAKMQGVLTSVGVLCELAF
jgi:hypothetical protein